MNPTYEDIIDALRWVTDEFDALVIPPPSVQAARALLERLP
jgi:hypothetical protein